MFVWLKKIVGIIWQIWSPTGPVNRDYDDVRRWGEAAEKGAKK